MKKFTIKNDALIKDKRSIYNIMNNIIISLIPLFLLTIYYNINQTFMFIATLFSGIIVKLFVNKKNILDIREIIIMSLIMTVLIPSNSNILIVVILSIIVYFIQLIMNTITNYKVNPILFALLLVMISNLLMTSSNELVMFKNVNSYLKYDYDGVTSLIKYLFSNGTLFLMFSYFFLVIKKTIKKNIVNSYLITSLIVMIIINFINNTSVLNSFAYILNGSTIFICLYIISNLETSPLRLKSQFTYGMILGVIIPISVYYTNNYIIIYIIIILGNLLVPLLNKYKKNV